MIEVRPQDLVDFGTRYGWGEFGDHRTNVLSRLTGPDVTLSSGELLVCDPFYMDAVSRQSAVVFPVGAHPTVLSVVAFARSDGSGDFYSCTAATVGDVDRVTQWRPLVRDGAELRCQVAGGMAVFLDLVHADRLRDVARDEDAVLNLADEVTEEQVAVVQHDGAQIGVAFMCSLGGGDYQLYGGYDAAGEVVSVLVDLELLTRAERRLDA
jgi:hypothetical protein